VLLLLLLAALAVSVVDFLLITRGEGVVLEARRFLVSVFLALSPAEETGAAERAASRCLLVLSAAAAAAAVAAAVSLDADTDDLRFGTTAVCFGGGAR
jgi:hypothetical protein